MPRNNNRSKGIYDDTPHLFIEDPKVIWRNFRGEDYGKNPQHAKGFSIEFDPEEYDIEKMIADGWNIKTWISKDNPDAAPIIHLPVAVRWDKFPPSIWMVSQSGTKPDGSPKYKRTLMDEESSFALDTAQIVRIPLIEISHGYTQTNPNTGEPCIKAYLKKATFELAQDRFDTLYDWDDEEDE